LSLKHFSSFAILGFFPLKNQIQSLSQSSMMPTFLMNEQLWSLFVSLLLPIVLLAKRLAYIDGVQAKKPRIKRK
jgi:hypothetical protein